MRENFYAQICNVQNMKQQKRENIGSIVLILGIIITIIIIITQEWNCDEIWFDPNLRWNKVICTYKLFQG